VRTILLGIAKPIPSLPPDWEKSLPKFDGVAAAATRAYSGEVINAIADAVTSFAHAHQNLISHETGNLQARLDFFAHEQRSLVDVATKAYSAIKTGHVGLTGATGMLLLHALGELGSLPERTLAEIRIGNMPSTRRTI